MLSKEQAQSDDTPKRGDVDGNARILEARRRLEGIFRSSGRHEKAADALASCCTWLERLWIKQHDCEAAYRNQCRHRMCPRCSMLKSARRRSGLLGVVKPQLAKGVRFTLMSLTIPHKITDKLKALIKTLFKSLELFRKTVFFRRNIVNWARAIEITRKGDNGYHPHVHFTVQAAFINMDRLHQTWAKCVRKAGGGEVLRNGVDLVELEDDGGIDEAIGYPYKVQDLLTWPGEHVMELFEAIKSRRLYSACQNWSGWIKQLEQDAKALAELEGATSVRFRDYLDDIRQGQEDACACAPSVVQVLRRTGGLEEAALQLYEAMPPSLRDACGCT